MQPVIFHLRKGQFSFDHAFFTSSDLVGHPFRKDVLDLRRLERMPWIGPLIRGDVEGSEYRRETFWRAGKRLFKRLYLLPEEAYLVWLEPQDRGSWAFATACTATSHRLAEYRRKTLLITGF